MTLVFIYNANSGALNALWDAGHKLFSPNTYPCRLCALTYNTFTEKTIWRAFRSHYDAAMVFYHIDEFELKFPDTSIKYPAVLKLENNKLSVLLNKGQLQKISTTEDLISRLKAML